MSSTSILIPQPRKSDQHLPPPEKEKSSSPSSSEDDSVVPESSEEGEVSAEKSKQKGSTPLLLDKITHATAAAAGEGDGEEELQDSLDSPSASNFIIKFNAPAGPTSPSIISKRLFEGGGDEAADLRGKKKMAKVDVVFEAFDNTESVVKSKGRVFTDKDIINLLGVMVNFKTETGMEPKSNMSTFYKFLKDKLHFEFTYTQTYQKCRRLKEKFDAHGENPPVFTDSHDTRVLELSKKIWGKGGDDNANVSAKIEIDENGKGKATKNSGLAVAGKAAKNKAKNTGPVVADEAKSSGRVVASNISNAHSFKPKCPVLMKWLRERGSLLKDYENLIPDEKAMELESKCINLRELEDKVVLKKCALKAELTNLVLESLRNK